MPWLTKSRFLSGLQCQKRLWFEIHQPLEEVSEPDPAILQGRSFDEVVQRLVPGVIISRSEGMPASIEQTSKVMAQVDDVPTVMYQPAFRAGDLAFIADVLRRVEDGFELIEVKAATQGQGDAYSGCGVSSVGVEQGRHSPESGTYRSCQ
jgi:hypothetical protein